ncbi:unnamed protein product [Caenorhabditis brenneri]
MRHKSQLTKWIIPLFICTVINAQVPSTNEILKTNQYFLITQQDSVTSIETEVRAGYCPQSMSKIKLNSSFFRYSGAHLIRDTFGRVPPKLMIIKDNENHFDVNIFTPNVSGIFQPNARKFLSFVDAPSLRRPRNEKISKKMKRKIKFTLFDSSSHMLYVDISTPDVFEMEQYYINMLHTSEYSLTYIRHYYRQTPNSRFDWQEDHYNGKFYYKERIDDEIAIFEIPMAAFIPTIWDGEVGVKVGNMKEGGTLMGASGGAFYTVNVKSDENGTKLSTSLVPSSFGVGIGCEIKIKSSDIPKFNKLIVVKNDDYCMLRDGLKYEKKICDKEREEFYASALDGESTDAVKWLLVVCITLAMIIVLLFVYIYWLRSTFVSDYDRTHPNEYETEASLFVAKQRSFPSVYQDPALLDVSIDKWN